MTKDQFKRVVARNLKLYRESKGISIRELAKMAGVKRTTIRDIEKENYSSQFYTFFKIASALGICLDDFIFLWEGLPYD